MTDHLTDSKVKKLEPPKTGNRITYDDAVAGFGCRVTAGGARSFILNYRTWGGRERRYTIGSFPDWSVVAAREHAGTLKQFVDQGGDPLGEKQEQREAPTVADLAARFAKEHLPRRRQATADLYRSALQKYILPQLGKRKVADVRFEDVDTMLRRITDTGGPIIANRCVAVLSKMMSLSIRWRMRTDNPCKSVEKNPEQQRRRYLKGDELERLTAVLAGHPDRTVANMIRLLLLTGARRGEVLGMRWADLDLAAGTWVKPGSETKQKREHRVPLSAPVRQLLTEIRDQQPKTLPEYVFPGPGKTEHIQGLKRSWATICKRAGISGLRVHDLRHSFASQLASGGASLPLIGALLGHSKAATTARYAHLFDDPQRAAVERVGAIITGQPVADVVPLKGERR